MHPLALLLLYGHVHSDGRRRRSIPQCVYNRCSDRSHRYQTKQTLHTAWSPVQDLSNHLFTPAVDSIFVATFVPLSAMSMGVHILSSPGPSFNTLQSVLIWVPEEDGGAARLAASVGDASRLQPRLQRCHRLETNTDVPVASAVLGATLHGVRVWQLHEVDHFWTDPQPPPSVGQLIIGSLRVGLQSQHTLVEIQRPIQILRQESHVVYPLELHLIRSLPLLRSSCHGHYSLPLLFVHSTPVRVRRYGCSSSA
mmetsp:Transcript_18475/g.55734  ORF Transcript_18475/g.55734 Transcript_18475/m.55734 type:complete len:253 (-) Transcript_18475:176-934(-)